MERHDMNILFVTATYPPSANGVANSVQRFARALTDLGHTVGVVGPASGTESDVRITYIRLPTLPRVSGAFKDYPLAIPIVSVIANQLNAVSWDVVHVHHPSYFARAAIRIAKERRIPVLFTHHTQYETYIHHFLKRGLLSRWIYRRHVMDIIGDVDAVIAPSRWMQQYLSQFERMVSLHYVSSAGLTEDFFVPVKKQDVMLFERPIFLLAMRLSREKNIPLAISAFHSWRSRSGKGILLIIGTGEQERAIRDLVTRLGIQKQVTFLGKQKNVHMPFWYRSADLLLYPSLSEVAPLTILEAQASGLPIVAVDHPAIREFIQDGKTGIITKSTIAEFASGIERALVNKQRISRAAKIYAHAYHITRTARTLFSLYAKVKKRYNQQASRHIYG